MRIAIQTLGTRGDVQPYVALGKGLQRAGYMVSLATAPQFESLVSRHGLSFAPLPGDITDLLQTPHGKAAVSGRNKLTATLRLLREVRPMFRRLVEAQWAAARGADAIVYHPKAVGGVHIAEKLGIPAFLALPLPGLSPTGEFPTPLLPFANLGPLNRVSHQLVARYGDLAFRKAVRRWRSEFLGLPSGGNWLTLRGAPVTKLYAYSPAVVSIPADWDATSIVTGYWFLDEASNWHAPKALGAFLESGPPPVYVGFGSLPSEDARKMTDIVLDALAQSGQRGVLATGWGGLRVSERPDHAFFIEAAPHDWLFPRVAAVVHHGGAGTTAAGLRAGRPTVVCPFIGDQPFWGYRIHALGAGPAPIPPRRLDATGLAAAIREVVGNLAMRERASEIGAALKQEDGVARGVAVIQATLADLEKADSR